MIPTVLVCHPSVTRDLAHGLAPVPMQRVALGRIRPKSRPKALRLATYLKAPALGALPASIDWYTKAKASVIQVLGNDQQGDCVMANMGHAVGAWTGNESGTPVLSSDAEALAEYHRIGGPGDNGLVISDTLDVFQSTGIKVGGEIRKIDGYVAVNPANPDEVKAAIAFFGGFTIGFNVPGQWMGRNAHDGAVWDNVGFFFPEGGHCVRGLGFRTVKDTAQAVSYNDVGVQFATWGFIVTITWEAMANSRIVDEAYVELAGELWTGADKVAPNGFDLAALKADLTKLGQGTLPDWTPPAPTPTPTPTPVPVPVPTPTPIPVPSGGYQITLQGTAVPLGLPVPVPSGGGPVAPELLDDLRAVLSAVFSHPGLFPAIGNIPWARIVQLIVPLVPVILADIQAGKDFGKIVADAVSALLAELGGNPPAPGPVAPPLVP